MIVTFIACMRVCYHQIIFCNTGIMMMYISWTQEMNDIRRELERHLAVEKETQEVELKAARERQMALGDLEHGVNI